MPTVGCSDDEADEEDYKERLRDISDSDFSALKAALRSKGALTSMCLEEMLYSVASTSCSHVPKPKRRSSAMSLDQSERSKSNRSRWSLPPHHTTATESFGEEEEEETNTFGLIVISRCA